LPHPSTSPAADEALGFGMTGVMEALPLDPTEARPWRDRATPLDTDGDRVKNMSTETIGESSAGLGLSGTGLGGGGKGAGIPLTDIAGMSERLRANIERMGSENSGAFGHVRGTHVPRPPPLQLVPVPRAVIERIVAANSGRFRACHRVGLRRNPRLSGRIDVLFTIAAGGHVTEARDAGGELDDEIVRICVVRTFLGLAFAPPANGAPERCQIFPRLPCCACERSPGCTRPESAFLPRAGIRGCRIPCGPRRC
jgi:hypothetical protein